MGAETTVVTALFDEKSGETSFDVDVPEAPVQLAAGNSERFSISGGAVDGADDKMRNMEEARMKGYTGDACDSCGNFTLVRNGTCLKCVTCGSTTGCS